MNPKILMITSYSFSGRYMEDMVHGFSDRGNTLGFISLSGAPTPEWAKRYSIIDFSLQFVKRRSLLSRIVNTVRVIRRFQPDVLQVHLFMGGIVGLVCGKLLRKPVILTRHHIDEHHQVGTPIHRVIDKFCASNATQVVVCSKAAKKWLIEEEGIKPKKITVINQGFNFENLNPTDEEKLRVKRELGFADSSFNVICIARYSRTKGQEYLVAAAKDLANRIPNLSITFIGPGESEWLSSMVTELGLANVVRVVGSRDDVPACIGAADLVVHPSLVDSFSQLIIEAQGVGGPIVASDIAAAREQIIDGVTGVIVPPKDVEALADAIERLYHDPELRNRMAIAARQHVRSTFTLERMIEEELECVNAVLKRPRFSDK